MTNNSMEIVVEILRTNIDNEHRIKQLKEGDAKSNSKEISELFSKIRSGYRTLIVDHSAVVFSEKKDVDGLLWKTCFYKQIEDFRKSIKKHSMQLEVQDPSVPFSQREKQQIYLSKLTTALLKFLSDSSTFYLSMMQELEKKVLLLRSNGESRLTLKSAEQVMRCIYRCLLYLGDISRYREIYGERDNKDFTEAERYYERAALIVSHSGNAQNQLAVLATYSQVEHRAVYHYCRSILVQQPFTGGLENLSLLFAKNIRSFAALGAAGSHRNHLGEGRGRKADSAKVKVFLTRFVRLHGMLFNWASCMHRDLASAPSSMESASTQVPLPANRLEPASVETQSEEFMSVLQATLEDFDAVLGGPMDEGVLLQLLAIGLFSVHYGVAQEENLLMHSMSYADELESCVGSADSSPPRTVTESLGLIALFGVINRVSAKIYSLMVNNSSSSQALLAKLLPMVAVFCDWARTHPHYLSTGRAGTNNPFEADKNLLLSEGRARSGMRASLSLLRAGLDAEMSRYEEAHRSSGSDQSCLLLREHLMLRGFLPLNKSYEALFASFDPLSRAVAVMSESASRYRRLSSIVSFISETLEPVAAQEAADSELKRQAKFTSTDSKKQTGILFDPNAGKSTSLGNSATKRQSQRRQREETTSPTRKDWHGAAHQESGNASAELDLSRMDQFPSLVPTHRNESIAGLSVGVSHEPVSTYASVVSESDQFSEALPLSNGTASPLKRTTAPTETTVDNESVPMDTSSATHPGHSAGVQFLFAEEEQEEFEDVVVFRPAFSSRSALLPETCFVNSPELSFSNSNSSNNLLSFFHPSTAVHEGVSGAKESELLGDSIFNSMELRPSVSGSRLNDYRNAGAISSSPPQNSLSDILFPKSSNCNEEPRPVESKLSKLFETDSFQDYWSAVPGDVDQVDTFTSLFDDAVDDTLEWQLGATSNAAPTHLFERVNAFSTTPLQSTPPLMAGPPGLAMSSQSTGSKTTVNAPPGLMQPPPPLLVAPRAPLKTLNPFYSSSG